MKYVDCSAPVREYLCQADPVLGTHIQRIGELYRPMKDDLFTALCSSIISQLISKKSAATVYNRLTEKCGGAITPQALAGLTPEEIQKCGMSMRKADNLSGSPIRFLAGKQTWNTCIPCPIRRLCGYCPPCPVSGSGRPRC